MTNLELIDSSLSFSKHVLATSSLLHEIHGLDPKQNLQSKKLVKNPQHGAERTEGDDHKVVTPKLTCIAQYRLYIGADRACEGCVAAIEVEGAMNIANVEAKLVIHDGKRSFK